MACCSSHHVEWRRVFVPGKNGHIDAVLRSDGGCKYNNIINAIMLTLCYPHVDINLEFELWSIKIRCVVKLLKRFGFQLSEMFSSFSFRVISINVMTFNKNISVCMHG